MKKYRTTFSIIWDKKSKKKAAPKDDKTKATKPKTVHFYAKSRRTHHDNFKAGYRTFVLAPIPVTYRFGGPQQTAVGKGWKNMDYKILVEGFARMLEDACTENYRLSRRPKKAVKKATKLFKHIPLFVLATSMDPVLFQKDSTDSAVTKTRFEVATETLIDNVTTLLSDYYSSKHSKKEDKGSYTSKKGEAKTKKVKASDKTKTSKNVADIKKDKYVSEISAIEEDLRKTITLRLSAAKEYCNNMQTLLGRRTISAFSAEDGSTFVDFGDSLDSHGSEIGDGSTPPADEDEHGDSTSV